MGSPQLLDGEVRWPCPTDEIVDRQHVLGASRECDDEVHLRAEDRGFLAGTPIRPTPRAGASRVSRQLSWSPFTRTGRNRCASRGACQYQRRRFSCGLLHFLSARRSLALRLPLALVHWMSASHSTLSHAFCAASTDNSVRYYRKR